MEKKKIKLSLVEWLFEKGHDYSLMHSAGVHGGGLIAFDHVDCKYYIAPEVEITGKAFENLLNYLRWEFDQFEEVTKEVEKEVEAKTKSGNTTTKKVKEKIVVGIENKNPPTPENIKKMKTKLLTEAIEASKGQPIDQAKILARVIPRLSDHEKVVAATAHNRVSSLDRLAADLKRQL